MIKLKEIINSNYAKRPNPDSETGELLREFGSDRSRIVFCTSFRKLMQKAQVFSLEKNTSVRNRLTHSLEVADIGKTIARRLGDRLVEKGYADVQDARCLEAIVENACLIHDIGNPPFGHFGEEAIKKWFEEYGPSLYEKSQGKALDEGLLFDFRNFYGNPQGFRIVNRLHTERDKYGLNLTYATQLASLKYPCYSPETKGEKWDKLGIFSREADIYKKICDETGHTPGERYFAVYLMELADDICYCLSDIADAMEKGIFDSRHFKEELKIIFNDKCMDWSLINEQIPDENIKNFTHQVAIPFSRECIEDAVSHLVDNYEKYVYGEPDEILENLHKQDQILNSFKTFSRKFIYTAPEAQNNEIAGFQIVHGLLEHFGKLLAVSEEDFWHYIKDNSMRKDSRQDIEWRLYNQIPDLLVESYVHRMEKDPENEWIARCRLILDYISGLTDHSALELYQNAKGISLYT